MLYASACPHAASSGCGYFYAMSVSNQAAFPCQLEENVDCCNYHLASESPADSVSFTSCKPLHDTAVCLHFASAPWLSSVMQQTGSCVEDSIARRRMYERRLHIAGTALKPRPDCVLVPINKGETIAPAPWMPLSMRRHRRS